MNYPPSKTPPWSHQVHVVNEAAKFPGFMVAHDMGAGKSKVAVDFATLVEAKRILILCPKSVMAVWPVQFERHSAVERRVFVLDKGSVAKRAEQLKFFKEGVVVVNYDAAWREPLGPGYEKNKLKTWGALLGVEWDLAILDESQRTKSPGGKASWFCKNLRKRAKRVLALTGTPMPHSPLDIYAQMRAVDPSVFGTSFQMFKRRYAVTGGYGGKEIVGFQNLDEMNKKLYTRMHRVNTRDVIDLPPVFHETRTFDLCPKARRAYDELKNELHVELENGEITAANALVKLLRLQQITGGSVKLDDGSFAVLDTGKAELLQDLMLDLPAEEPIIIFCLYWHDMDMVHLAAKNLDRASSELSGRANNLQAWQQGQTQVLAVQIRAGGLGVDLTRARYCAYYSLGYSLGDYMQSLARPMRPGQLRSVYYYHLVANKSVDEKVYASLKDKQITVDNVLGHQRELNKALISEVFGENVKAQKLLAGMDSDYDAAINTVLEGI